jgi:hypothetical protein
VQGAGQFGPAPQALTQALMQGVRQFGTGPQALTQTLTQGVGQFGPKDIAQALVQGAEQLGPQNLARTLMQGTGQFGSNPQALTQGLMQGTSGFNPIGLVAAAFGGAQALADPKASQALTQALMRGTGGFNPQGLAAAAFGGSQALANPNVGPVLPLIRPLIEQAPQLGMTALQNWRNLTSPESIQQARAFYDHQIAQGQKQGGVGGFFQQALGYGGGTTLNVGLGAIDTLRNWDTMAQAQAAQTFFANQVIAGQREGGVTGFFRQGMGYAGGTFSALPLLATQISPAIDGALDWHTAQRQQLRQFAVNNTRNIPILGSATEFTMGALEQSALFSTGVLKGAGSLLQGTAQMITNPVDTVKGLYTMAEHIPVVPGSPNPFKMLSATGDVLFNGADPKQRFDRVLNPALSQQEDGQFWQGAWNGATQPYQKAWNEGRPAEAIGRGAFDLTMTVLGMRQLGRTLAGKPPATQPITTQPPSTVFTPPPQTTGTLPGVNQPPKPTVPTVLPPTNGQPFTGRPVVPPAPAAPGAPGPTQPAPPTTVFTPPPQTGAPPSVAPTPAVPPITLPTNGGQPFTGQPVVIPPAPAPSSPWAPLVPRTGTTSGKPTPAIAPPTSGRPFTGKPLPTTVPPETTPGKPVAPTTGDPAPTTAPVRVTAPGERIGELKSYKTDADVPEVYRNDPRFRSLAADPDQGGKIKPQTRAEAMAGLQAEAQGLVPGPLRRGPRGIEFYDSLGRPWDVKAPPSPGPGDRWPFIPEQSGGSIVDELRYKATPKDGPPGTYPHANTGLPEPRRVILNSAYLSREDHAALWQYLRQELSAEELSRIVEINTRGK